MGSGNLIDLTGKLPVSEPTVQDFVRAGVDVITFSGDKLLGGPQAGVMAFRNRRPTPMKVNPAPPNANASKAFRA